MCNCRFALKIKKEITMIYKFDGSYTSREKDLFQFAQESDLKKITRFLETESNELNKITFRIFDTRVGKQKADPYHSIS